MPKDYSKISFIELKSSLKTQKDAAATYLKLAEKDGPGSKFSQYAKEREQIIASIQAEIDKRIEEDSKESKV